MVNASKILDDNKEPLIMYHGSSQDFWSFDMSKADLNRNSRMQGSFFSDSAEVASAYTVRPLNKKLAGESKSRHAMIFLQR